MYDFGKTIYDDREFMEAMKSYTMYKTEEEVLLEYYKCPDNDGTIWTQIMLAGILGSREEAINKYPEVFI
ncbi:MAG: hypothetical protein PVF17_00195 [Ignavibacteria bacterium]|jgi:hypothetical protein